MRPIHFIPLALAAGCIPNNAELTGGTYWAFLAASSSQTLFDGDIKLDDAEEHYAVDCRQLGDDPNLEGAIDVCGDALWPPQHEGWLRRDGFEVVKETLDPWRGEAVMTSEGDVQVTFHHSPPGNVDFRFAFVVNPDFAPRRCVEQDSGDVAWEPVDGDWLEEWSDGNQRFYLNSGAYQFNPSNTGDLWVLPQDWRAGVGQAKFAAEELRSRRVRYGLPSAYTAYEITEDTDDVTAEDLFYVEGQGALPPEGSAAYQDEIARVEAVADLASQELGLVGVDFVPNVETNEWRTPDGNAAGLDAWVELHYSWVDFDASSDLTVGGSASGEFHIVYDALDSQSRVIVTGSFDIPRIKRDRWVTDDVQEAKLEENDTVLCGESFASE